MFRTSAPSRLTGSNSGPAFSVGARHANSASAAPPATLSPNSRTSPRVGSVAKACTDVITPERTRNVPSSARMKVSTDRKTVHDAIPPRFSVTISEWTNAALTSHGMKDAFSTGSQNHQPPQPSS